ncbi:hypothetical protein [Ructibacterium gallinarum]|uniref:Uncharacterized protein n=1 Tax=Ructibacterium gallinarum TaxID=2779355 RepID=A0A9D5RC87_9FIRM|nr:hypothetical protein [Ructibacterium gallinarum]MBE5040768.1 hypothetical protein [Ructibacterium gallinarum]
MPDIIFKRIMGGILLGSGCLVVGVVSFIAYGDSVLLCLSVIVSAGMVLKAWLLCKRFKNNQFIKIVGVCTKVDRPLFSKTKSAEIQTDDKTMRVCIPKETKLAVNKIYAFYFAKKPEEMPKSINQRIANKMNADNFLGCEEIEDQL